MPTRGRQQWAEQAIYSFMLQTYPNKELIIVDDSNDPSFTAVPESDWPIQYSVSPSRSIAEKRNMACGFASGDIICHWDSDDWSDPDRLAYQVTLIEGSRKSVAGFCSLLFHVEQTGQAFKYVNQPNVFALGTSLCYLKSFWEQHPFRPDPNALPNVGEDSQFVKAALHQGELISVDGGSLMVARIHSSNTSPKHLDGAQTSYRPVSREALPKGFFA